MATLLPSSRSEGAVSVVVSIAIGPEVIRARPSQSASRSHQVHQQVGERRWTPTDQDRTTRNA